MTEYHEWYREFFDQLYYEIYRSWQTEDINRVEAEFIARALDLPQGSRLLDVGCGYARHAVYLAHMGYYVVCLDISDYLLEKARERIKEFNVENRVSIARVDMRYMDFENEFDGAYIFFTTFGFFSDEENERVIENLYRALKPRGRLLIDLFNPMILLSTAYHISTIKREGPIIRRVWWEEDNYIVLEESRLDLMNARSIAKRIILKKPSMEVIATKTIVIRFYMLHELRELLERHGFKIVKVFGGCKGEEYTPTSPRLIVVGEKVVE